MISLSQVLTSRKLPTVPSIAMRLVELTKDPDVETKQLVGLIRSDPALSARILRLVNATHHGLRSAVCSVERAVPLLGRKRLVSLALSFSMLPKSTLGNLRASYYERYWLQSIVHALAAESLGRFGSEPCESEYFLAGLLMDFGRLALLSAVPADYIPVIEHVNQEAHDLYAVETERLGVTHVDVGLALMKQCRLSDRILRGIRFHHAPLLRLIIEARGEEGDLVTAVAVAAAVGELYCSPNKGRALGRLEKLWDQFYRAQPLGLEELFRELDQKLSEADQLFDVNTASLIDAERLMAEAGRQLAQLKRTPPRPLSATARVTADG